MYLRITQRQNRDGSTVAYYALAESVWNPDVKRREARMVHSFGRAARRIEAHVKLCVLALQIQRAAEIRCQLPWARIAHTLGALKAVRYRCEGRAIVQRTKISAELSATLKTLGISAPKQLLA